MFLKLTGCPAPVCFRSPLDRLGRLKQRLSPIAQHRWPVHQNTTERLADQRAWTPRRITPATPAQRSSILRSHHA